MTGENAALKKQGPESPDPAGDNASMAGDVLPVSESPRDRVGRMLRDLGFEESRGEEADIYISRRGPIPLHVCVPEGATGLDVYYIGKNRVGEYYHEVSRGRLDPMYCGLVTVIHDGEFSRVVFADATAGRPKGERLVHEFWLSDIAGVEKYFARGIVFSRRVLTDANRIVTRRVLDPETQEQTMRSVFLGPEQGLRVEQEVLGFGGYTLITESTRWDVEPGSEIHGPDEKYEYCGLEPRLTTLSPEMGHVAGEMVGLAAEYTLYAGRYLNGMQLERYVDAMRCLWNSSLMGVVAEIEQKMEEGGGIVEYMRDQNWLEEGSDVWTWLIEASDDAQRVRRLAAADPQTRRMIELLEHVVFNSFGKASESALGPDEPEYGSEGDRGTIRELAVYVFGTDTRRGRWGR